jgi:hypothetical protein
MSPFDELGNLAAVPDGFADPAGVQQVLAQHPVWPHDLGWVSLAYLRSFVVGPESAPKRAIE